MTGDLDVTLQLVRRAKAGDRAALNSLFERYGDRVRRIVRLRLGAGLRNRLDSADIVQETFLVAVQAFERFEARDEASLLHWLSALALNRIRDAADRHGAEKRDMAREVALQPPTQASAIGIDPQASGPTPADRAAHDEMLEAVEAALCELPAEQRELVVQREYLGREWNEVAEHTGHPSGAAARMAHGKVLLELAARVRARRPGS